MVASVNITGVCMEKYYVGLDLGTKWVYGTILNEKGGIVAEGKINCTEDAVGVFLRNIPKESLSVVIEACGIWYPLYDFLVERCSVVKVANPLQTRWIGHASVKTDKIDSKKLAMLLRMGNIPESYIPSKKARDYKQIVRVRQSLVNVRTQLKNMVHARLRRENIKKPPYIRDIFTKKGIKWLRNLKDPEIDCYLNVIEADEEEIEVAEAAVPSDMYQNEIKILKTIPGVSDLSAATIMSIIVDAKRFPTADALCSYAGLGIRRYQSGNTDRSGGITKQGPAELRRILVQDANVAVRSEGKFKEFFTRLIEKKNYNVAITAVARKMLYIIWFMLITHQEFDENK